MTTRQPSVGPQVSGTPHRQIQRELTTGAAPWPSRAGRAELAADVDPEALTVMAEADADMAAISHSEFDANLARDQAGAQQLAAQRERDQAERDRAAVDEPVARAEAEAQAQAQAQAQAEMEAAAATAGPAERAETDDMELEI